MMATCTGDDAVLPFVQQYAKPKVDEPFIGLNFNTNTVSECRCQLPIKIIGAQLFYTDHQVCRFDVMVDTDRIPIIVKSLAKDGLLYLMELQQHHLQMSFIFHQRFEQPISDHIRIYSGLENYIRSKSTNEYLDHEDAEDGWIQWTNQVANINRLVGQEFQKYQCFSIHGDLGEPKRIKFPFDVVCGSIQLVLKDVMPSLTLRLRALLFPILCEIIHLAPTTIVDLLLSFI
jgi:hypothetical protein